LETGSRKARPRARPANTGRRNSYIRVGARLAIWARTRQSGARLRANRQPASLSAIRRGACSQCASLDTVRTHARTHAPDSESIPSWARRRMHPAPSCSEQSAPDPAAPTPARTSSPPSRVLVALATAPNKPSHRVHPSPQAVQTRPDGSRRPTARAGALFHHQCALSGVADREQAPMTACLYESHMTTRSGSRLISMLTCDV
jgi:hypothetical protein